MLITLATITSVLAIMMPFSQSILIMGAILISLALLSTMTLSVTCGSWFGFILFLIYITGLLVLFGYMLVVSPNLFQKTPVKDYKTPMIMIGLFTASVIILTSYNSPTTVNISNLFSNKVATIFTSYNMTIYLAMVSLLFVALIMAVHLCYKTPKPMRSFLN